MTSNYRCQLCLTQWVKSENIFSAYVKKQRRSQTPGGYYAQRNNLSIRIAGRSAAQHRIGLWPECESHRGGKKRRKSSYLRFTGIRFGGNSFQCVQEENRHRRGLLARVGDQSHGPCIERISCRETAL